MPAYPFEDMGEQSVKNIARPVQVYALHPNAVADLPVSSLPLALDLIANTQRELRRNIHHSRRA